MSPNSGQSGNRSFGLSGAGKGDKSRVTDVQAYRRNFDEINWGGENECDVFEKCVVRSFGGWPTIKCRLGLWRVNGPDEKALETEARSCWIQYFQDGEYKKFLSNE